MGRFFKRYFFTPSHPINLAVARIAVFYIIYGIAASCLRSARRIAGRSNELLDPPFGVGWLIDYLPLDYGSYSLVGGICLFASACACVGLFSRVSCLVASVSAAYVLGVPNFYGKVNHSTMHLISVGLILASSRCGDFLSVDRLINRVRSGRVETTHRSEYTFPLRVIWILIGLLYFFPGFWKLRSVGLEWALSDNILLVLQRKWFLVGFVPIFPIHQYPLLCKLGGVGVLLFELGFIMAVFNQWTRLLWVLGGLIFHVSTYLFMGIPFWPLMKTYLVFVPWDLIFRRSRASSNFTFGTLRPIIGTYIVAMSLMFSHIYTGSSRIMYAWPIACYPTFDARYERQAWMFMLMKKHPKTGEKIDITPYPIRLRRRHALNGLRQIRPKKDRSKPFRAHLVEMRRVHKKLKRKIKKGDKIVLFKGRFDVTKPRKGQEPDKKFFIAAVTF